MRKFGAVIFLFLILAQGTALGSETETLIFPEDYVWIQVTDQSDAENYLQEWVREGEKAEEAKWLLVKQKLQLPKKQSSKKYIKSIFKLARSSCSDVLYNGPEKLPLDSGAKVYVGRIMCAQQINQPYGSFTDMSVLVEGTSAYVFTSELRIPPSPKAGILSFDNGSDADVKAFMADQAASARIVRSNASTLAE